MGARQFEGFTCQALQTDAEITAKATQIHAIRMDQAKLRSKHEAVNHVADLILEQQEAVSKLYTELIEELELKLSPTDPIVGMASRTKQCAECLQSQLDELDRQVQELTSEATEFQVVHYSKPLEKIAH